MPMDAQTTLIEPLGDRLNYFLFDEFKRVLWQAAALEAAMKLHQARMKDLCYAIKAHYHWANFEPFFPDIRQCRRCGDSISPEFAFNRHKGFCILREKREAAAAARSHEYALVDSWA